jgi:hypothetical protein
MGPGDVVSRLSHGVFFRIDGESYRASLKEDLLGRSVSANLLFESNALRSITIRPDVDAPHEDAHQWFRSLRDGLGEKYGRGDCRDSDETMTCVWRTGGSVVTLQLVGIDPKAYNPPSLNRGVPVTLTYAELEWSRRQAKREREQQDGEKRKILDKL